MPEQLMYCLAWLSLIFGPALAVGSIQLAWYWVEERLSHRHQKRIERIMRESSLQ